MKMLIKTVALSSLLVATSLYAAEAAKAVEPAKDAVKIVDINAKVTDAARIAKEDLGTKKEVTEEALGLRKTDLYAEADDTAGEKTDYSRPAPGTSTKFERAFENAPPMIPHSVDGLLPITKGNNQCIGCHMPKEAKSMGMGATPIPVSHMTNYRPDTKMDGDKVVKEGKVLGASNTSDVLIAKAKTGDTLYQGRFNCSQCHAPQSKGDTVVGNTFKGDFKDDTAKSGSNLMDVINEGVK